MNRNISGNKHIDIKDVKYAMFNRVVPDEKYPHTKSGSKEWVVYDKDFNRLGIVNKCPDNAESVSPARVYTETKRSMGLID